MISLIVVIINTLSNMSLQFPGTVVMLKFNNVLHRPVVSLDLTLGLRMNWFSKHSSGMSTQPDIDQNGDQGQNEEM